MEKAYVVHTDRTGQISVIQVEIERITAMEDPSVMFLPNGEFRARILNPTSLWEKNDRGVLVAPVWHNFALYSYQRQACLAAVDQIRNSFEFARRKYGTAYTPEEVQAKIDTIKYVNLSQ